MKQSKTPEEVGPNMKGCMCGLLNSQAQKKRETSNKLKSTVHTGGYRNADKVESWLVGGV